MLLPVGLAVVGRSSAGLIAYVRFVHITAFGADGFDMLAVRGMVYASSNGEQAECCFCCDVGAFSRCG